MQRNTIKDNLSIFKIGKFYNIYGDDAIIFHYLFGYKILIDGKAGFPESALIKVKNTLDDEKIDYSLIYKEEKPENKKFGNFNSYKKILRKSLEHRDMSLRVERIIDKINEITDIKVLDKLIGVIEDELQ